MNLETESLRMRDQKLGQMVSNPCLCFHVSPMKNVEYRIRRRHDKDSSLALETFPSSTVVKRVKLVFDKRSSAKCMVGKAP